MKAHHARKQIVNRQPKIASQRTFGFLVERTSSLMDAHTTERKPPWRPDVVTHTVVVFIFSLEVYQRLVEPADLPGPYAVLALGGSLTAALRGRRSRPACAQQATLKPHFAGFLAGGAILLALVILGSKMTGNLFIDFIAEDNQVWNGAIYRAVTAGDISFSMPGGTGPVLWITGAVLRGITQLTGRELLDSYERVWLVQFLTYAVVLSAPTIIVVRRLRHDAKLVTLLLAVTTTTSLTFFVVIPAMQLGHLSSALFIVTFACFLVSHQGFRASLIGCVALVAITSFWAPIRTLSPILLFLYLGPQSTYQFQKFCSSGTKFRRRAVFVCTFLFLFLIISALWLPFGRHALDLLHEVKMLNSYGGGTNAPQSSLVIILFATFVYTESRHPRTLRVDQMLLIVGLVVLAACNVFASVWLTGRAGYAATKFSWIAVSTVGLLAVSISVLRSQSLARKTATLLLLIGTAYFINSGYQSIDSYENSIDLPSRTGWQETIPANGNINGCVQMQGGKLMKSYESYVCSRHMMAFNGVPGLREWNLGWSTDVAWLNRLQRDPQELTDQLLILDETGRAGRQISVGELIRNYILTS